MRTIDEAAKEYADKPAMDKERMFRSTTITDFKAGVEFAQKWISVKEEKPEYYKPVNVKSGNLETTAWRANNLRDIYTISGTNIVLKETPTHWKPINLE